MTTGLARPDRLAQFNDQETDQQGRAAQRQTAIGVRQRHQGHHSQADHKDVAVKTVAAAHQTLQRKRPRIRAIRMAT